MVVLSLLACGPGALNELPEAPREGDRALVVRGLEVARPAVVELRFTVDGGPRAWTWRDELDPGERVDPLGVQFRERVTVEVLVDGEGVPDHASFDVGPALGPVDQVLGPVGVRGRVTLPFALDVGPPVAVDAAAGPPDGLLEPRVPDAAPLRVGAPMEEAMAGWSIAEAIGNSRQLKGLRQADGTTRAAGIVAFASGRVHDVHLQLAGDECGTVEERLLATYGEPTSAREEPLKMRRWEGAGVVASLSWAGERCTASWRAARAARAEPSAGGAP